MRNLLGSSSTQILTYIMAYNITDSESNISKMSIEQNARNLNL
ncbi:hypothetical protein [Salegentibacter agarivorans]|nr:hypothetical protein [Salegentibacter agarivorans]